MKVYGTREGDRTTAFYLSLMNVSQSVLIYYTFAPQSTSVSVCDPFWFCCAEEVTQLLRSAAYRERRTVCRCHGAQLNNWGRRVEGRSITWLSLWERSPHSLRKHLMNSAPFNNDIHSLEEFTPDSRHLKLTLCALTLSNSVFVGKTHKSHHMLTHHWHPVLASSLAITFITTFIIIYMTNCVGLYSKAWGWQGLGLKGSDACWDCGLLREWHSGRRCPAGRASGGCSMVNRPFMASPQSLLSPSNSSCPAWRDGGGRGTMEGLFFGVGSPPILSPLSLSTHCSVVQGGASVREPHTNRALLSSNNTKTLAGPAKCWQSAAQHWKTPMINESTENILKLEYPAVDDVQGLGWGHYHVEWLLDSLKMRCRSPKFTKSVWWSPTGCLHTKRLSPEQEQQVPWNAKLFSERLPAGSQ